MSKELTDLQARVIVAIDGLQQGDRWERPPTRQNIHDAVNAQVDKAIEHLVDSGLVELAKSPPGYRAISQRFKLVDKPPTDL